MSKQCNVSGTSLESGETYTTARICTNMFVMTMLQCTYRKPVFLRCANSFFCRYRYESQATKITYDMSL